MSTLNQTNVPYLDGWRGMAIILVLIGHFGPARFWYLGRLGVMLFFVLSGFFMARLLFIKKVPLSSFFAKRFSRIVPTLWLFIVVMYFYARYGQPKPYVIPLDELLSTFLFMGTYFPAQISIWAGNWSNGHLWSLNVEEHSYLFLAAGAFLIAKTRGRLSTRMFMLGAVLAIMGVTLLYMTGLIADGTSPWRTHTEVAALGLIASAAISVLRNREQSGWFNTSPVVPIVALAAAAITFNPRYAFLWNVSILVAPVLAAVAVNHAENFPALIKQWMSLRILRWFGVCSFSIYLWQMPLFSRMLDGTISKPLGLVLGVALGTLSFYCFENPVRLYLNRRWAEHEMNQAARLGGIQA